MTELTKSITYLKEYRSLKEAVQQGKTPVLAVGLSAIHKAHLAAALGLDTGRPVCVLTDDDAAAARFSRDLQAFAEREVLTLPARELVMADYGAPTTRKRFCLIAQCDGKSIVWPERTHAPRDSEGVRRGVLKPWRSTAEVIDW